MYASILCMYVYIYVYVYQNMSIYMTVYKCICMHEYMHVCMNVLYAYIRVCNCACIYVYIFSFFFTFFIESKRTKTVGKQNTIKTEQRNNVQHKAIILKDKRQEKTNTFLLSHVGSASEE